MADEIIFFGETTFRDKRRRFGIKTDDRRRHTYLIGKTGMGKSAMLENMAIQDIQLGHGIGFVDPHGEAAEGLLDFIPSNRINDVVYFNPADIDYPVAFNIMEKVDFGHRHLVASGLMGVFKKIWPDVWSARMEYILNNCILALLEYPGSTLLGVNRMLADIDYRKKVVDMVTDPMVKSFWVKEFARYTQRYEVEATAAIQNKVGQFISAPLIRNIIGQVQSKLDMREIMDENKILILNLSKGRIGEDNSMLLGALLITKLQLAAMSRVDIPEEKRKDFFLYVDEFQNFATISFVNVLSEARKYRLSLILGHQYITQMEEEVRDAVFGNVGTLVSFRIGADDAEFLEREYSPDFIAADFVNLKKYNIYVKLMIDGLASRPFSAETLSPFPTLEKSNREKIIQVSRERYSSSRQSVEEKISKWSGVMDEPQTSSQTQSQFQSQSQSQYQPQSQVVLYDAKCASCEKWTKVTFLPDPLRPVYCKSCLKKIKNPPAKPEEKLSSVEASVPPASETFTDKSAEKLEGEPAFAEASAGKEKPETKTISLTEATKREPFTFSKKRSEEKQAQRKEVNLEELKSVLEESLKKIETEKKDADSKGT
ncbi:MAG: type IV secretion system DNA-binding domain-containing protein [bacterium]|nr:type IV secretion system DNA-binding domain-containing protein [bacterium]